MLWTVLMKRVVEGEEKVLRGRKRRVEVRVGCGVSRLECGRWGRVVGGGEVR